MSYVLPPPWYLADSVGTWGSYIIERWREALLWTWLIGKIGSGAERPGMWGLQEARAAWRDLGGVDGVAILKAVKNVDRETLSAARLKRIIQDEELGTGDGDRLRSTYVFGKLQHSTGSILRAVHLNSAASMMQLAPTAIHLLASVDVALLRGFQNQTNMIRVLFAKYTSTIVSLQCGMVSQSLSMVHLSASPLIAVLSVVIAVSQFVF